MAPVEALPTVLLENVLTFLRCKELLVAEQICRAFHATIHTRDVWQERVRSIAVCCDDDAPTHPRGWKALACLILKPCDPSARLLDDVIACSTIHRSVETPSNTLKPSRCWNLLSKLLPNSDPTRVHMLIRDDYRSIGRIAQTDCGCFRGPACYWSSTPSTDKNAVDFIDYKVLPRSLVRTLQIVPYRAFWHPHNPTYGPVAASLSFYCHPTRQTDSNKQHGELIYTSPLFPLENEMTLLERELPVPVWLPNGGIVRLNLVGRHQIEPFELRGMVPDNHGDYYSTLSYVNLVGARAVSPSQSVSLPATAW